MKDYMNLREYFTY